MAANLYQMDKNASKTKEVVKDKAFLHDHQKNKKDAIKTINTDAKMQRESLHIRLNDRRRRSSSRVQTYNSMFDNSNNLKSFGESLKDQRKILGHGSVNL